LLCGEVQALAGELDAVIGVEIVGVARDLQFPENAGVRRVREVDDKEGIDPLEGDHVEPVPDEPGGVDLLVGGDVLQASHGLHAGVQDKDVVVLVGAAAPVSLNRRRRPEDLPLRPAAALANSRALSRRGDPGQPFDIHGGGLENIFPHNECEIAQTEAATGESFCNYWLLNNIIEGWPWRFLKTNVKDYKMSELFSNLLNLDGLTLVSESRVTSDHQETG
jgi:hypothetical protein